MRETPMIGKRMEGTGTYISHIPMKSLVLAPQEEGDNPPPIRRIVFLSSLHSARHLLLWRPDRLPIRRQSSLKLPTQPFTKPSNQARPSLLLGN